MKICPIILAGGSGTRLWPISRAMHPKQFLGIKNNNETMLQATVRRLSGLRAQAPITICNEEHRFFVADQLKKQIAQKARLHMKICISCGARLDMSATRCRKCRSTQLRLKNRALGIKK